MRASHVTTALAAFTAGLTAATALHRRAERSVPVTAAAPAADLRPPADGDAVVLPFARPAAAAPAAERPAAPTRCGDSGGRTRAGAPCGARATTGGRCHHHRLAA
ncbi:hypothetical protein [Geodermatophilus sp. TF02-6]|uniref:hypothetical protein n=1 Tax=Geodermatophilus sp. TF02-6 TaxID=2250575 RepID=UPI0018F64D6B|nr:hypothetical protein [Geodermatophilus sp. TF02-6]